MGVEESLKGENGKMKSDLEQTEIEAPYELPEGWMWVQQRYCHTDSILLRKISNNDKREN